MRGQRVWEGNISIARPKIIRNPILGWGWDRTDIETIRKKEKSGKKSWILLISLYYCATDIS